MKRETHEHYVKKIKKQLEKPTKIDWFGLKEKIKEDKLKQIKNDKN